MTGEDFAGRGVAPRPAGEESRHHSGSDPKNHDAIAELITRIREAAASGAPLAACARVTTRNVGRDLFRVQREGGR